MFEDRWQQVFRNILCKKTGLKDRREISVIYQAIEIVGRLTNNAHCNRAHIGELQALKASPNFRVGQFETLARRYPLPPISPKNEGVKRRKFE